MILCHMISHSSLFKKEKTPTKMVFSHHFCESPIIPFPPCLSIQRCGKRKIHKLSGSCQFQHRVNCMMKRSVSKHFSSYLTNHLVTHITVSPCRIFYLVLHFFFFFFLIHQVMSCCYIVKTSIMGRWGMYLEAVQLPFDAYQKDKKKNILDCNLKKQHYSLIHSSW